MPTPGFPNFYYMLDANLGLLLYEVISVMFRNFPITRDFLIRMESTAESFKQTI